MNAELAERSALVRRGALLAWFTIGWNAIEGVVGVAAGVAAGSIALVGFGVDSYVEVFAGSVIVWRLSRDGTARSSPRRPSCAPSASLPSRSSLSRRASARSPSGSSSWELSPTRASSASANAALGWWWADPLAGLGIVYVAGREGLEHLRTDKLDDCC
jgi:hypothetical protein